MRFPKVNFLISAAAPEQFPDASLPEIAIVGRSNVGKSSLINHFSQNKKMAHISSKPGKTRLLNFFCVDNTYHLVDLPGYGFAKVPKKLREQWGDLTQAYLESRKNLSLILLLVDVRHPPTKDDLAFAAWASHFQKPFILVFTKADKLKPHEQKNQIKASLTLFEERIHVAPVNHILYSIKDANARVVLTKEIQKVLS